MSKEAAMAFVDAINRHNVPDILALMTEDHVFIDAYGGREDKVRMSVGWQGYFDWFPDYRIEVTTVLAEGDTVGIFGFASGTYQGRRTESGNTHWHLPAAWKAVTANGKVKVWQVFCDSKLPYETMEH